MSTRRYILVLTCFFLAVFCFATAFFLAVGA